MPFTTISSGLTLQIPTPGTKNWATTLQEQCWDKISEHDHTGSGKGKQIGTNAISNLAITSGKLADDAVTTAKLDGDAASRSALMGVWYTGGTGTAVVPAAIPTTDAVGAFYKVIAPKALKITHLGVDTASALNSGSLTFILYKNGVTTGQSITISSGSANTYGALTPISFAAGDLISMYMTKSSLGYAGTASSCCQVWGHFTE